MANPYAASREGYGRKPAGYDGAARHHPLGRRPHNSCHLHELCGAAHTRLFACPSTCSGRTAAWYVPFYLCFAFALYERKSETQKAEPATSTRSSAERTLS